MRINWLSSAIVNLSLKREEASKWCKTNLECLLIEIHSNIFTNGWMGVSRMNINLVSVIVSIICSVNHIQISFFNVFKIPTSGLNRIAPYVYYLRYTIEVFFTRSIQWIICRKSLYDIRLYQLRQFSKTEVKKILVSVIVWQIYLIPQMQSMSSNTNIRQSHTDDLCIFYYILDIVISEIFTHNDVDS